MAPNREDNRERIRRMAAEGLLDPAQAEMLRVSLAAPDGGPDDESAAARRPAGQRPWPGWLPWVLLGLALLAALATGAGGPAPVQDVTQSLNQPGGY